MINLSDCLWVAPLRFSNKAGAESNHPNFSVYAFTSDNCVPFYLHSVLREVPFVACPKTSLTRHLLYYTGFPLSANCHAQSGSSKSDRIVFGSCVIGELAGRWLGKRRQFQNTHVAGRWDAPKHLGVTIPLYPEITRVGHERVMRCQVNTGLDHLSNGLAD